MNQRQNNEEEVKKDSTGANAAKAAGRGVKAYLSDWRNWLTHGLVGVAFLLLAIFAPIELWIKLVIIACVITFNCVRMSLNSKKKKKQKQKQKQAQQDRE